MSQASLTTERIESSTHPGLLQRIFTFPAMLASLFTVLSVLTLRDRFDDPDMWWHMKTGEIIWNTHRIPTTDLFSYTTNHHFYIPHEWLSQLLIYAAYRFWGYSGLMLWLCVFTSAILIAGYVLCSLYSGNSKVAFAGTLTIYIFGTIGFAIRPQVVGYLLLIFELILLHLGRTRSPRWFYGLPPLFAVWVNCHGSFSLGLATAIILLFSSYFEFQLGSLVAIRWESRRSRSLLVALSLSVAALFLNPSGIHLILYPFTVMMKPSIGVASVSEWMPLQINDLRGFAFAAVLAAIFLLVIARKSELLWHELLWIGMAAYLAASHRRLLFPFGILTAPILTRVLASSWQSNADEQTKPVLNAAIMAISLLLAFAAFPDHRKLEAETEADSPVKAVEYIHTHQLSGPMLNEWLYGGYLIWAAPEHPVFIDGRSDVFEWTHVIDQYGDWVTLAKPPNLLLDKYHISFCLLTRNSPLAVVMGLLPQWRQVYSDTNSVIFVRTPAVPSA